MYYLFLLLLAAVPPLAFLAWVYYLDEKEKEPKGLIIALFIMGVVSVLPIAFAELIVGLFNFFPADSVSYAFVENFMNVAVCEEVSKFLCMFALTWKNKNFNYKYDAIVYAVAVSIGFATMENILYVFAWQIEDGSGLSVAITRMLLSIPGHLVFAICMGLFYGRMKMATNDLDKTRKIIFCVLSLLCPIIMHGFYNFCLSVENGWFVLLYFAFVIFLDVLGVKLTVSTSSNDEKIADEVLKNHDVFDLRDDLMK